MITFARAIQLHQLVRQATTVVVMLVLAQLGLALVEIGNYESLRFLAYALTGFWVNGLSSSYLRIRQTSEHPQRWFVFFLLIVLLGAILVFGLFASALNLLGSLFLSTSELTDGLAFGTYLMGFLAGTVVEQEAIADQKGSRLLFFSISSSFIQVLLFLGPLVLGMPLYLAMWGLAASGIYRLAWVAWRYSRQADAKLPTVEERKVFWNSASALSVYGLSAAFVLTVDHALVGYSSADPKEALAIWRYGAQEIPLLLGVVSGLNSTALAEMQEGITAMLGHLKRRAIKLNRLFLPLAILLAATSRWFFPLALTESFYPAHVIFNTILLVVPSRLVLTTPLLISLDEQRFMTKWGWLSNLANAIISVALMLPFGLLGIALGTVISFSLEKVVFIYKLRERGHPFSSYIDVREWLWGSVVLLLVYGLATDFSALLPV